MASEIIVFKGIKFRRYPDAKQRTDRVYFTPGIGDKQRGIRRLHEEIWIDQHGPIPDGYHVHHADHDPLNNHPSNLVIMSEAEHHEHHGASEDAQERLHSVEWLAQLESIRPLAAAWHSSPEGIAWHSEHGRRIMEERKLRAGMCEHCGNAFVSKQPERFCSNACKSASRRNSGIDDIEGTCVLCGTSFTCNRYKPKITCSRSCASKLARATDKARKKH